MIGGPRRICWTSGSGGGTIRAASASRRRSGRTAARPSRRASTATRPALLNSHRAWRWYTPSPRAGFTQPRSMTLRARSGRGLIDGRDARAVFPVADPCRAVTTRHVRCGAFLLSMASFQTRAIAFSQSCISLSSDNAINSLWCRSTSTSSIDAQNRLKSAFAR